MNKTRSIGAIEAGGTKFICMVGNGPENIEAQTRIATTIPNDTLQKVIDFFRPFSSEGRIKAIGVGCFGPLDLDPNSDSYGFITSTPKAGWDNTNIAGRLRDQLKVNIIIDMDVNTAALGEYRWGASRGLDPSLYLTIGTGIGGGYVKDGKPLMGLLSPEMGHIHVPHNINLDPFPGSCPFHGDCFEGLASGPALQQRLNVPGETVPDDHPFWEIEAGYIASALTDYIFTLSPKRIILGGGVMHRTFLFPMIRRMVLENLHGYLRQPILLDHTDRYIVPPGLGDRSGILGALALVQSSIK